MLPLSTTVHTSLGCNIAVDQHMDFLTPNVPSSDSPDLHLIAGGDATESQPPPAYVVESGSQVAKPPGALDRFDSGSGVYRLHDLDYGELGLFTESLGCESSEGTMSGEEEVAKAAAAAAAAAEEEDIGSRVWQRRQARRRDDEGYRRRSFPPPLRWLTEGRWRRFMRVERDGGRVRMTEMQMERPEIMRAYREGGRLRLVLVAPGSTPEEETEVEEEEEETQAIVEEEEKPAEEEKEEGEAASARCQASGEELATEWGPRFETTA